MTKVFTSPPRKRGSRSSALDSRFRGNDGWKKRVVVVGVILAARTLAGCGKKGPPGPPPGVPNTYPQNYPQQ
jgi:predicted small lipoprotein YifL